MPNFFSGQVHLNTCVQGIGRLRSLEHLLFQSCCSSVRVVYQQLTSIYRNCSESWDAIRCTLATIAFPKSPTRSLPHPVTPPAERHNCVPTRQLNSRHK